MNNKKLNMNTARKCKWVKETGKHINVRINSSEPAGRIFSRVYNKPFSSIIGEVSSIDHLQAKLVDPEEYAIKAKAYHRSRSIFIGIEHRLGKKKAIQGIPNFWAIVTTAMIERINSMAGSTGAQARKFLKEFDGVWTSYRLEKVESKGLFIKGAELEVRKYFHSEANYLLIMEHINAIWRKYPANSFKRDIELYRLVRSMVKDPSKGFLRGVTQLSEEIQNEPMMSEADYVASLKGNTKTPKPKKVAKPKEPVVENEPEKPVVEEKPKRTPIKKAGLPGVSVKELQEALGPNAGA